MSNEIQISSPGNFSKTYKALHKLSLFSSYKLVSILDKYGQQGVKALKELTPKDTGDTASSWTYSITVKNDTITLSFNNSEENEGIPIAILIQYGHATGTGGYVLPVDYINPALGDIFENIAKSAWKEVRSL